MIYIQVYFAFLKIGILSFGGGYAALPIIQEFIVNKYAWLDISSMIDIVSISQMTPGPIAINAATFVGMKLGGILGAIFATLGVVTPQILIITIFLKVIGFNNKYVNMMLDGINVSVVALILSATFNMINASVIKNFNILTVSIFVIGTYLYFKGYNLIHLIIFSGIIGVLGVVVNA